MPNEKDNIFIHHNSEEVQEIITAVPSWILRRGITLIFLVLLAIVLLSAFIRYPDVVKTNLKVNSINSPKAVYAKSTGKIVTLLVKEGTWVEQKQPLAFMESTGRHHDVLKLVDSLKQLNAMLLNGKYTKELIPNGLQLGELQTAFQVFYQQYQQFLAAQQGGYYQSRKKYLQQDLHEISKLKGQILAQQKVQEKEYANVEEEYGAYKKLYQKGVVSKSEFKQQENRYFSSKYPLQQSQTALLNNNSSYETKQKEIFEINHTIEQEQSKFVQALNNMITQADAWINQYVLNAPVAGSISYAGIVQENQTINTNQELFMVNPVNAGFFGEIHIPQYNMGKVKEGQRTLVKLKSFPFEQFGLIRGKISYISEVAFKDSVFIAKVSFERYENINSDHKIILKNGMLANAEIITEDSSLLQRFLRNITKMLNNN